MWCGLILIRSKGHEIRKDAQLLFLSSNAYNRATGFVIVSPITSTIRTPPIMLILYPIKFVVRLSLHFAFILWKLAEQSNRKIDFIERMNIEDFYTVAQFTKMNFDFKF